MKTMSALFGMSLVVIVAVVYAQNPDAPHPKPVGFAVTGKSAAEKDRAAKEKPFRYTAEIRCHEIAGGESHDLGSVCMPIVGDNEPATVKMTTGKQELSVECTVSQIGSNAMAEVSLSVARNGTVVFEPTVRVAIGRKANVHVGDNRKRLQMEVLVYGR